MPMPPGRQRGTEISTGTVAASSGIASIAVPMTGAPSSDRSSNAHSSPRGREDAPVRCQSLGVDTPGEVPTRAMAFVIAFVTGLESAAPLRQLTCHR